MAPVKRRAVLLTAAAVAIAAVGVAVPAPVAVAAAAAGVVPGKAELTLAPGESGTVAAAVTTPAVAPDPDIVFLADTTGSMDPALANVRNALPSIIDEVRATQPSARFGVAEYKSQADGSRAFRVDAALTDDRNAAVNGAQQWLYNVGGGGGPQSDFLNAHYQLATGAVEFRPVGSRVVVWFGDARSADPSLGHTLSDTVNALRAGGIRVIAVPVVGTSAPGLDERGQATSLTNRTFGVLMPSQSAGGVATAILGGLSTLTVPVAPVPACDQQLTLTPDRPTRMVRSGGTASFTETVAVAPNTDPGTYRCTVDFQVSGTPVGITQTVTVRVPGTLPVLRISDVTVDEGDYGTSPATLTVTMDRPSTGRVTIDWATVAGTAGIYDFSGGSGTLTFEPGETSKQVTVDVIGDEGDEQDEWFTVHLSDPEGATIENADGVVTIRDDDETPVEIRISDTSVPEADEDTTGALTVSLNRPSDQTVTVYWQMAPGTASGTDYDNRSGSVVFGPGSTSAQLPVTIRGDDIEEPDETFSVHLFNPTGALIADADGVVTIVDDDGAGPAVRIGRASVAEGYAGTTPVTLTVVLDRPSTTPVPVQWTTEAYTANADDFVAASGTVTFEPGQVSAQITVQVRGDAVQEGDEWFLVHLSGANVVDLVGFVTITDDDADTGPHPTVPPPALRIGDVTVPEGNSGDTPATVTVALEPNSHQVSVHWTTDNGTATAPGDFTAGAGTLVFAPGETSKQITVPVTGESSFEDTETFAVHLSAPDNAEIADGIGVVTIANDDDEDSAAEIGVDDATVTESAGQAVVNVRLTSARDEAVTVRLATEPGSATDGCDYHGVDTTVTFEPGETLVSVPVEIVGDTDPEPAETFTAELSAPVGATIADPTAIVTIEDDDEAGDLPVVSVADGFAPENAGQVLFEVHLTKPASGDVTVHWTTEPGTATGADFDQVAGDVTFAPGETVLQVGVPLYDDDSYENDETFTLTLSSPVGATLGDAEAAGVIVDDDDYVGTPVVSVSDAAGPESGGPLGFEVRLSEAVPSEVTVDWTTTGGTAVAPYDYEASSGTVVFAPGQSTATVWVPLEDDSSTEPDETFTLSLSGASGAMVGDGEAVGTIVNDDYETVTGFTCSASAADVLGSSTATAGRDRCADDRKVAGHVRLGGGLLTVRVDGLTATTDAAQGGMSATAALRTTRISTVGLLIEIGETTSTAMVTCVAGPKGVSPALSGSSTMAWLKVNGRRMPIGTGPVRIPLEVGSLSLNSTVSGPDGLTQRAFDLRTPLGDVVVGSSSVGMTGNPCR
ncbi:Calx-beta domain-containing protein [Actinophytocola oryzae]|nr:Calx-beta domain-containing protein [Actinophytocola oryzae]